MEDTEVSLFYPERPLFFPQEYGGVADLSLGPTLMRNPEDVGLDPRDHPWPRERPLCVCAHTHTHIHTHPSQLSDTTGIFCPSDC